MPVPGFKVALNGPLRVSSVKLPFCVCKVSALVELTAPKVMSLPFVFSVPLTVVVLAVLVNPPLKLETLPALAPIVTPFVLLNVVGFVIVLLPFKIT